MATSRHREQVPAGAGREPGATPVLLLDGAAALLGSLAVLRAPGLLAGPAGTGLGLAAVAASAALVAATAGDRGRGATRVIPHLVGVAGLVATGLDPGGGPVAKALVLGLAAVLVARLGVFGRTEAGQAAAAVEARAELARRDVLDDLTGLPNRANGMDRLDGCLVTDEPVAVVLFDVDRLTLVNESLGYSAGDAVMAELSRRVAEIAADGPGAAPPPGRFVARHEGDSLLAVLPGPRGVVEARSLALAAVAASERPVVLPDGTEVEVTVSAGVALSGLGESSERIVAGASLALNRAKQQGRRRVEVMDEGLRASSEHRLRREQDLRRALTRHGEIEVWCQPVVELASGLSVGGEALVRWRHPFAGVLEPQEFLGTAEETGLIVEMGTVVLERACVALRDGTLPWVAVNLSARELYDPGLVPRVRRSLDGAGVEPGRLCVEVNEQVLLDASAMSVLRSLEALGVGLAIDDFGVGASSLLQLQMLRAPLLKIDRSFVAQLSTRQADRADAVIGAIAALAEQVCIDVVAEGVETEAQLARLRAHRIRYAQGHLFGRPAPLERADRPRRPTGPDRVPPVGAVPSPNVSSRASGRSAGSGGPGPRPGAVAGAHPVRTPAGATGGSGDRRSATPSPLGARRGAYGIDLMGTGALGVLSKG